MGSILITNRVHSPGVQITDDGITLDDVFNLMTIRCPSCQQMITVPCGTAYTRQVGPRKRVVFCSYHCLRAYDLAADEAEYARTRARRIMRQPDWAQSKESILERIRVLQALLDVETKRTRQATIRQQISVAKRALREEGYA